MPREKNPTAPTTRKRAPRAAPSRAQPAIARITPFVDPQQRAALIAEAAYFRAEKRGFAPGDATADWLAAEAEVDASLLASAQAPPRG
jgi:hypothetical protein